MNIDALREAYRRARADKPFYELYFTNEMQHGVPCGPSCGVLPFVWLDYLGVPKKEHAARWLVDSME